MKKTITLILATASATAIAVPAAAQDNSPFTGPRVEVVGGYDISKAGSDIDNDLNDSDSGNAYGFGINLFGNETTSLNLHVLDFDEGAFTTTTIGFQHYFGGFR